MMACSCITFILRIFNNYITFLLNLFYLISGVGFFIFTIFIHYKYKLWDDFFYGELSTPPIIMSIIGLVLFVIGLIGLCGIINMNPRILTLFTILQTILVIAELVIPVVITNNMNEIKDYGRNVSFSYMREYNSSNPNNPYTKFVDDLQINLECCGTNEPKDWIDKLNFTKLPMSCCEPDIKNETCTLNKSHKAGCFCKIEKHIFEKINWIMSFAVGLAIVQILVLVFTYGRATSLSSWHFKYLK